MNTLIFANSQGAESINEIPVHSAIRNGLHKVADVVSTDKPDIPTLIAPNQPMTIANKKKPFNGIASWFTPAGVNVRTQHISDGLGVVSPNQSGIYILTIVLEDTDIAYTNYLVLVK